MRQKKWSDLSGLDTNFCLASCFDHSYIPKDDSLQSETVHYKRGVCQQFCLPSHTVDPAEWAEEEVGCAGPSQGLQHV